MSAAPRCPDHDFPYVYTCWDCAWAELHGWKGNPVHTCEPPRREPNPLGGDRPPVLAPANVIPLRPRRD